MLPGLGVGGLLQNAVGFLAQELLGELGLDARGRVGAHAGVVVEDLLELGAGRHGQHVGHRHGDRAVGLERARDLLAHRLGQLGQQLLRQLVQHLGVDVDLFLGAVVGVDHALHVGAELLGTALAQHRGRGQLHLLLQQVLVELQAAIARGLNDLVDAFDRGGLHAHADQGGDERLVGGLGALLDELGQGLVRVQVHPLVEVLRQRGELLGPALAQGLAAEQF